MEHGLAENIDDPQLIKKIIPFYGIRMFVTVSTRTGRSPL